MKPRAPQVRLIIDRLVLRGFRAEQRDAIAAALGAELHRVLADAEALRNVGASRSLASLRPGRMQLTASAGPRQIGAQAAQVLTRSLQS